MSGDQTMILVQPVASRRGAYCLFSIADGKSIALTTEHARTFADLICKAADIAEDAHTSHFGGNGWEPKKTA